MTATAPAEGRWRTRHLLPLVAISGFLALGAAAVGWLAAGGPAAAGAAAGVAMVTAGYVLSTVAIARANSVAPALVLPVGLVTYTGKLAVVGAVLLLAAQTDWPGLVPMCYGVAAGVVGWNAAQIWWLVGRRGRAATDRIPR